LKGRTSLNLSHLQSNFLYKFQKKEKRLEKLETDFSELQAENEKLVAENRKNQAEFDAWKKKAQSLLARRATNASLLHQSISTPTLNKENLIVNDTIQIDDFELNTSDTTTSNINKTGGNLSMTGMNLLDANVFGTQENEPASQADTSKPETSLEGVIEEDVIEMRCNSMFDKVDIDFDSPEPKRRKNPFVSYDLNDQDKIPAQQQQSRGKFAKFKSFNELSLSQRFKDSPVSEVRIVKPIVAKRPRIATIDLEASMADEGVQVPKKVNAFSYLSDGFGGRTKVLNKNDKIMPLGGIRLGAPAKKSNFLTKSKFSK
jgi:hypothetical protein